MTEPTDEADVVRLITILRETGDLARAKEIQVEARKALDNPAIQNVLNE